jgi:transposase
MIVDVAKNSFRVHRMDAPGKIVLQWALRRRQLLRFVAQLAAVSRRNGARGGAYYWAREIANLGR